jgi:hypothetical protein
MPAWRSSSAKTEQKGNAEVKDKDAQKGRQANETLFNGHVG